MSYLVLARKYRPRSFTEMVGQEHVVQALSNALTQQRLHHAYLFTGTRGVGKTTVSRILAKSLNCQGADGQGGITAEPCGVCQACRDIDAGRFVDYTELDAASNRGVDEVQSLLEQAVYKPVQGRFKVFMIDEVHMLTNTAFNAMLKTLEEPPEYLKFVLATTDPQKVPVTVLSRCLQFNLRPMAPETVFEHLTRVLAQESIAAEPQALRLLSRAARGSMRDALSLTDQAIAFGSGQLQEAGVRQMLGSVDRSHVLQLLRALANWDGATVVALVDALRLQGVSAAATLEDMGTVLQRMAVLQAVPGLVDQASDDPDAPVITELSQAMSADVTQLLYSLCLHGRTELGLAPDEYAALTMVLLRLLAFAPGGASGTAEKKSPELSAARSAAVAAVTSVRPAAAVKPSVAVNPPAPQTANLAAPAAMPTQPLASPAPAPMAAVQKTVAETPAPELAQISVPSRPATPEPESVAQPVPAMTDDDESSAPAMDDLPPWEALEDLPAGAAVEAPPIQALPVVQAELPAASRTEVLKRPQAPLQTTPEGDFWYGVVQQLVAAEAVTALVRELALQSQLLTREGDVWRLCVDSESLARTSTCDRLQVALHGAGHAVRLQVSLGAVSDSPAKRNAQAASARMDAAIELIENDPLVQSLVREWDARIVPGSIQPL
jgi:DNA polymerase-3 subunit gamma/tau